MQAEAERDLTCAHPGFAAIVAAARRLGLPKHYPDDLYVHDRKYLDEHPDVEFGWMVRDMGTHLFFPEPDNAGSCEAHIAACGKHYTADGNRWFWWDGAELVDSDPKRVLARIRAEEGKVHEAWAARRGQTIDRPGVPAWYPDFCNRYQVCWTDGWLCVRYTARGYTEPVIQVSYYAIRQEPESNSRDLHGLAAETMRGSGVATFTVRISAYGPPITLYSRAHGGVAMLTERYQLPAPKVRKGIEVRYHNERWEKRTAKGWVGA